MKKFYYSNRYVATDYIKECDLSNGDNWIVVNARNYTEAMKKLPLLAKEKITTAVYRYESDIEGTKDPVKETIDLSGDQEVGFTLISEDDL